MFTFIDCFCGAGGLSLGLKNAGLRPVFAFDTDEAAVNTYEHNLRTPVAVRDIRDLSAKGLRKKTGLRSTQWDLIVGGPPCQGFSKQGKGNHLDEDYRNDLIFEIMYLIHELQPKYFLIENVEIFGQKRGFARLVRFQEFLSDYLITTECLCAANYGVPQMRRRFFCVGSRRDQIQYRFPLPALDGSYSTVRDAIGDLPSPPLDGSSHPEYDNHRRTLLTPRVLERFKHVPPGGGWKDIPEHLRNPCHGKKKTSGGWPDVYGRLEWDKPCMTITGGFDSFTRGRYGHPEQDRPLTPREAARLQTFPDDFVFLGNRTEVRRMIGNAVPPLLAEELGKVFVDIASRL